MFKKISVFMMAIMLFVFIVGCGAGSKPEDTVKEFVEGMKKFDVETMVAKVKPEDAEEAGELKNLFADEEGEDELGRSFKDYFKKNLEKITYEIKDVKVDGDKATVTVDFKYIDGSEVFAGTISEYFTQVLGLAFSGEEVTEERVTIMLEEIVKNQLEAVAETTSEKTVNFECVNIDKKWYIDNFNTDTMKEEILDILTSNFLSVTKEFADLENQEDLLQEGLGN